MPLKTCVILLGLASLSLASAVGRIHSPLITSTSTLVESTQASYSCSYNYCSPRSERGSGRAPETA